MDDKYVALSLKKDRGTGFKLDIDRLYVSISPQVFNTITTESL
jgi:hypothetical protein